MSFFKYRRLIFASMLGVIVAQGVYAGVWLDIQSENENGIGLQAFNRQLNWLDGQNDLNANLDPWMGMRIFLKWGQIPYQGGQQRPDRVQYDFSNLVDLLNAAYYRGDNRRYQALLTISDKLWIYQRNGLYSYYGGHCRSIMQKFCATVIGRKMPVYPETVTNISSPMKM